MRPLSRLLASSKPEGGRRRLGRAAAGALIGGLLLGGAGAPSLVGAQDASPAAGEIIPATDCTTEPLTDEYLAGLAATPEDAVMATPSVAGSPAAEFTPPAGEAASEEEVVGVTDTVRQVIACLNAADYRRVYALYSESYLVRNFSAIAPDEAQATPNPTDEAATQIGLVEIADVVRLDDGRIGARITLSSGGGQMQTVQYSVFVMENDRYLVDEETVLGGEPSATPAA